VPVYVRSTMDASIGLDALRGKGAIAWPNPQDADEFEDVFDVTTSTMMATSQSDLALFSSDKPSGVEHIQAKDSAVLSVNDVDAPSPSGPLTPKLPETTPEANSSDLKTASTPADTLFAAVRDVILPLVKTPMKDVDVAAALDVPKSQAKVWLQRLVDEGVIETQKKPAAYIVKLSRLFD